MDNSYDDIPPEIADMPLSGGTTDTTPTVSETPATPVQPAEPDTTETDTPADDGTTPPTTDKPTEPAPASANDDGKSTELQEGKTPESSQNLAYQAWIDRQRTKNETAAKINDNYSAPTVEQLQDQGYSEQDARIEAKLQEISFAQERARVSELNASMRDEATQVQQQFGIFNPNSPDYDKDFAEQVGESYKQYAQLQTDDNGIILSANVPLYDYYQQQANLYNRALSRGQQNAQANTQQMVARTENPGGSASNSKRTEDMSQEEFLAQYGDQPLF